MSGNGFAPSPAEPTGAGDGPGASALDDVGLQALFRSVVLQANDVVLVTEAEPIDLASGGPRVVYVNPAFTEMTGYASQDIIGRTPRMLQSPGTDRAQLDRIRRALTSWQPVEVELLNVSKDGSEFWVQISISPVADERGYFTHWIAIQREVTGRRLREETVHAMLAGSSDLLLLLDPAGSITAASRSSVELLGRAPEQLLGCDMAQLLHPDDRKPALAALFPPSTLRIGAGTQLDVRMSHAAGSWRWMRLTCADGPDSRSGMVVVNCADLTPAHRSAAELQDVNDKFRSAFFDAPIGMSLSDAQGRLVQTNAALVQLLGHPEPELLQMTMDDLRMAGQDSFRGGPGDPPVAQTRPRRQETALRRADGSWVEVLRSSSVIGGTDGRPVHVVDHFEDITDRKSFESQLQHQALHDPLTGLATRALLTDRIEQALSLAGEHNPGVALLFLDLDRFKSINDSLGHAAGDAILAAVGKVLQGAVRTADTVARFGGDEFVVLCPDCAAGQAASMAARIQQAIADCPVPADADDVRLSASIGIALSSRVSTTAVTLLRDADAAMYAAKARGGNRVEIFDEAVGARVRRRVHLEGELRRAIPAGQLRLHYQPIVELVGRRVAGLEALVRWQHPERGLLLPGDFIPLAEESGLILELGAWVMDQAVAKAAAERRQVPAAPVTWVNLSAAQLHDNSFPDLVRRSLGRHGVPGSALGLEITESMLVDDLARTTKVLRDFRDVGIRCAIDDFGTGYSSLSYLARFPVDTVKIDQSFVAGLEAESTRRESYAIINAVVGLARALELDLVAEGIETPSQAEALHGLGCDYGQGYLLGRPAPR